LTVFAFDLIHPNNIKLERHSFLRFSLAFSLETSILICLQNATNKRTENPMSVCAGMGDPRPNIICPQESDPERYCLNTDNPVFCKTIGDICDADGFVKPEYPYCTTN
jgi:hypothetical protein